MNTPATPRPMHVEDFYFSGTPEIPNNLLLPLVVYRQAVSGGDLAAEFEKIFARNHWPPAWRYGIYPFAHYHSTAHEAIGVYRGRARVHFGHTAGITLDLQAGDAVVIPAGTGHQCLEASPDFHAVGAYPEGQTPDLLRADAREAPAARERIDQVPLPDCDPIAGRNGPLAHLW
jgi:uncharacterized protein YjlB